MRWVNHSADARLPIAVKELNTIVHDREIMKRQREEGGQQEAVAAAGAKEEEVEGEGGEGGGGARRRRRRKNLNKELNLGRVSMEDAWSLESSCG